MDNTKTIEQGDLVWCEDHSQDIIGYFEVSLGTDKYITIVMDYEKAGVTRLNSKRSKHGDAVWQ